MSLALALPVLVPSVPALAQTAVAASPTRPMARGRTRRSRLDDRVKVLAKSLDLSEEQQVAVKKILEQRQEDVLRLRLDPSSSGRVRINRFRAIQDTTVGRIRAVLNEEQRTKYDPLAPRKLPPAEQQRSVEDWIQTITSK